MNILFLSHRIPFPPNKGDKIRSFNEIKFLSKEHNVYLATTCDDINEYDYIPKLEEFCNDIHAVYFNKRLRVLRSFFCSKPFSVSSFYDPGIQEFVDRTIREKSIDVIFCFCSSMAEYVLRTPKFNEDGLHGIKLIIDFVDLDSDKWRQYAEYSKIPMKWIYHIENKRLFQYEKKINDIFHHSIFVSSREKKVLRRLSPNIKNIEVIPNGVSLDFFSATEEFNLSEPEEFVPSQSLTGKSLALVFTGVMDYFANEDGVKWFCEQIFPIIRKKIPQVEFYIVGNNPTDVVWNLSEIDGVTVTGYVEDIREFYMLADICVIPLRIARGLQNKVLEAMASGKAIVATSNASDGLICHENEDILIADSEEEFAEKVITLMENDLQRDLMGGKAIMNVEENYSWDVNLSYLNYLLSQ